MAFAIHARLAADTIPVCDLGLCTVLLMNDARFPWLILVPRQKDLVEIMDLGATERAILIDEIARVGETLRSVAPCDKINIGALGNVVPQLHVHVVARVDGDAAWPGPVWGSGAAKPYDSGWAEGLCNALRKALRDG
jgi:diadenosine tetraphosphate (Ap4A) HIT family hydrolase